MLTEKQKLFIKNNGDVLSDIYSDKMTEMMKEILDSPPEARDRIVDTVNVLKTWLREIEMVKKGQEIKKTTFI